MFGNLILLRPNNHDGGVFPIMKQSLKLGRDPACQIQLRMPLVSRFHCCIAIDPPTGNVLYITQAYVSDTSANGTAVNGVPLRKTQLLEHGDHICIGERKFRFEYPLVVFTNTGQDSRLERRRER